MFVLLHRETNKGMKNQFLETANNGSNTTLTENGAMAFSTVGTALADQFGKAGSYRGRDIKLVFNDQQALWNEDPEKALRFIFYLRNITRKVKELDGNVTEVTMGQGNRDESFKRLLWLAKYQPETFYKNLIMIPLVGSWKDLWTLLYYDKVLGVDAINYVGRGNIYHTLMFGMKYDSSVDLIKKFMPRIRAEKKCTTEFSELMNRYAKEFARYMKVSYAEYNKFKSSGNAHTFQQLISKQEYDKLDWNKIPGKAMLLMAASKFLDNHDLLEPFSSWVESTLTAKFTGYAYDLVNVAHTAVAKNQDALKILINKQFDKLISTAKEKGAQTGNVWCALDTSGSMSATIGNGKLRAIDVCIGLGVFFSTLNTGEFHKSVVMFDDKSTAMRLKGDFCDMVHQIEYEKTAWGSTNFNSVIAELVRIRRQKPYVPLEDYPTTILVVSDMQFNDTSRGTTPHEESLAMLRTEFPDEYVDNLKFVWWDCTGRVGNYPATLNDSGNYFFSGFDGSIVQLLLGDEVETKEKKHPTMEEIIERALNQKFFDYLKIS